jgi:hypothetical protein
VKTAAIRAASFGTRFLILCATFLVLGAIFAASRITPR